MVQIIQSGPSAATLRQQALDNSFKTIVGGLSDYKTQEAEASKTLRQQALQEMQLTQGLKKEGYDVTSDQVSQVLNGPKQPSAFEKLLGAPAVPDAPIDLYAKRTPEYLAKQKLASDKAQLDSEISQTDLLTKKKALEKQDALTPLEIEAKKLQIDNDKTMSPIKRRAEMLNLEKLQGDIATQPYQQQKLIAEAQKAQGEANALTANPSANKLSKLGGEDKGRVGSIASGLKALTEIDASLDNNVGPKYIDANTPLVGGLISDNSFTKSQRVLDEVIGRLQSGGAIGVEETKTFRSLGPRPGDSPKVQREKLAAQKSFLLNKLTAFGFKESELGEMGFDTGNRQTQKASGGFDQAKASRLAELRAKAGKS